SAVGMYPLPRPPSTFPGTFEGVVVSPLDPFLDVAVPGADGRGGGQDGEEDAAVVLAGEVVRGPGLAGLQQVVADPLARQVGGAPPGGVEGADAGVAGLKLRAVAGRHHLFPLFGSGFIS